MILSFSAISTQQLSFNLAIAILIKMHFTCSSSVSVHAFHPIVLLVRLLVTTFFIQFAHKVIITLLPYACSIFGGIIIHSVMLTHCNTFIFTTIEYSSTV